MENETLELQKRELRKTMFGHLGEFARNSASVSDYSLSAQERLLASDIYARCGTVLVFVSIASEPDTVPIIKQALSDGKLTAVPKVLETGMEFFRLDPKTDLESQLFPGSFGIREPDENSGQALLSALEGDVLVLVPGLSFSTDGKRLGKGKGYYDRFLAELCIACRNRVIAAGYCFDFQVRQNVPVGNMDMPMDYVITDKRIISC